MSHVHHLTIACILLGAGPALAADKPAASSALPAVQAPAPGTASRQPATVPGAVAPSAVAVATPLKCSVSVEQTKGNKWGGGGTYRSYKVTNSLGGRQPLAAGSRIKWSASVAGWPYGGEHVLEAPLPPGQSIEVGATENPKPAVDPKTVMKGSHPVQPTCDAKLLP